MPVDYFQPENFQQANPALSGVQAGQQIYGQSVQNAYLQPTLQQQLQQLQLANAAQQIRNSYLGSQLQSGIGLTQAQTAAQNALPNYYSGMANEANARGQLFGSQANLMQQQTPYLVQQAQGDIYKTPGLQTAWELANAQRTGQLPSSTLGLFGQTSNANGQPQAPIGPLSNNPAANAAQQQLAQQAAAKAQSMGQKLPSGALNPNISLTPQGTPLSPSGVPLTREQAQTVAMVRAQQQVGMNQLGANAAPKPGMAAPAAAMAQNAQTAANQQPTQPALNTNPNDPQLPGLPTDPKQRLLNTIMTGSPYGYQGMQTIQAQGAGKIQAAKAGVAEWNDARNEAAADAKLANQATLSAQKFITGYDNSTFRGAAGGTTPSRGWGSILPELTQYAHGKNLSPEQQTDQASAELVGSELKPLIGGRLTNYEIQGFGKDVKPSRQMDYQTAHMAADFIQAKSARIEEAQQFYAAAQAQGHMSKQDADALWQNYQIQRPVYNFETHQVNTQYQNSWAPFLSAQAINALHTGQNYVPIPDGLNSKQDFQGWMKTLPVKDQAAVNQQLQQGGQ
jgi:hypothetical protein